MATPTTTVPEYCNGLTRSRLLPGERVDMLHNVWLSRAAGSEADVDGFRKFLIAGRHLTEYQAALLQRGHTDGFLIGGYVILDRIGKGQSAGVYKAVHPGSGQVVALKALPGSRARNPHTLARFQREGRLLTQLDHPNVVRAFQVGSAGGVNFIVMEHLDGETLDEVLARRRQLPPTEAVRLIVQALNGLQHLHDKRMIHRDLKPANLMLVPANGSTTLASTVKVLDIGLGRELFDEDAPERNGEQITVEGTVLGTPDYLAPEQARDARAADVRADIYSLGCVLFHLLAGRPPFVETNIMAAMVRHATEPPPAVTQFQPATPPDLAAVLEVMLAKKAADRFGIPRDAAEALEPFLPTDSSPAMGSRIIPAFTQWLAVENREVLASIGGPRSSSRIVATPRSVPVAAPPLSGPVSSTRLNRGLASGQGTGTTTPLTLKPPSAARPAPHLVPPKPEPAPAADADVELMPLDALQAPIVYKPPLRPLWNLDRRDFIMLGIGSGGVLAAIAVGVFAAKFNRRKIQPNPNSED
jgi:serine/threonine protein kinase